MSFLNKAKTFLMLLSLTAGLNMACAQTDQDNTAYTDYYKVPANEKDLYHISTSQIDYSDMAQQITASCHDDYQKIRAIYQWICENISYDTSYKIHTADKCIMARKGVCQAYCELFYHLAKAVGVRAEIVPGIAKDHNGVFSRMGHAWIFAYTRENHGILLDPTWGAGFAEGNTFTRSKDCWLWFNPSPEWMALSHLPDDDQYQLIAKPVSKKEFKQFMPVTELWVSYGLDPHDLYTQVRNNTLSLPKFYSRGEGEFQLIDFPRQPTLRIGQFYTFRIRMKSDREFSIGNGNTDCRKSEWTSEGDGVYSVSFMPRESGTANIELMSPKNQKRWEVMVQYAIEPPTAADWAKVERYYPLSLPEAQRVAHLDAGGWQQAGIDNHRLITLIREQNISSLPILFRDKGQKLKIVSVPMNYWLKVGQPVTFSFYPESGVKWAIVNGETWYRDWLVVDDQGLNTMTLTPQEKGLLTLYVQLSPGESYISCLEYSVE